MWVSVQFSCSVMSDSATPWITACQASLSVTNSRSSLRLTSIKSVMPSSHLILCCPLLLLPPIPPSIRVFSNESTVRMRWPKYWSFSFSIIPSKEHPGLISFRMDWLDLLAVQGTLRSLLQHHSSKASILRRSASSQSNSHIHTWPQEIWVYRALNILRIRRLTKDKALGMRFPVRQLLIFLSLFVHLCQPPSWCPDSCVLDAQQLLPTVGSLWEC